MLYIIDVYPTDNIEQRLNIGLRSIRRILFYRDSSTVSAGGQVMTNILTILSEAGRCVKILETLSLRGNFWPGACASALIDLQKALGNKLSNGTLGQHVGLQSRTKEMRTSTDAPNSISRQNLRLRNSETGTMQDTRGASATPRAPNPDFLPHGSSGAYRGNRQAPSMDNSIPAHLGSPQGDMSISFQQNEASTMESNRAPGYVGWPMLNGPTYQMGDQFNGFDDIFQLMDASYQINEQMYEPGDMTQF